MRINRKITALVGIAMLAFTLSACDPNAKAKAQEIPGAAGTWCKLQMAYIVEFDKVGNFEQIRYTAPKSSSFKYGQKIENGVAGWLAESTENLGDCPAGSQWIVLFKNTCEAFLPNDKNCQELTPNFGDVCKSVNEALKGGFN